jgi:hypothetical protein
VAYSSPLPDLLLHCACRECSFKGAGTYAAVEIARHAHCHPNSILLAIDRAQRGVWTRYFESPPPLLVDTTRLPQPYPRLCILGATLAALIVTAGGALFSRWLVRTWYHHPLGGLVLGSFMLLVVGGLVYTLLSYVNDRRAASIHRLRVVAECNHHIRNALQALTFTPAARTQLGAPEVSLIGDSVHRIELTLAEVLPGVFEGSATDTGQRGRSRREPPHPSFPGVHEAN